MIFRRINHNDPDPIHYSPTDLTKCPIQVHNKKTGVYISPAEKLKEIFQKGNKAHILEGIKREGSKTHVATEVYMKVIHIDKSMIFSGYADFIMYDGDLYIEDLKTCDLKAFYHFFTNSDTFELKVQLNAYRYLYYVLHGVLIDKLIVTKIDRNNLFNRISLQISTIPIDTMEKYIMQNPAVLYGLKEIDKKTFLESTLNYIKDNDLRWLCRYCNDKKTCPINKKLTLLEKKDKEKDKKQKELFDSLVK